MKVMALPAYGLEALSLQDVTTPTPGPEDLLVDIVAASVNAADWHVVRGDPFLLRLGMGLLRPRLLAPGADVAGRVRAVGEKVTAFKPGDEVVADLSSAGFGAFAEQVVAPAKVWVKKPAGLSFADAAAVPMAGMTALKGLRDIAKVRQGERVLVIGAAGGVGSFAVQLARALGAQVVASCRKDKAEAVVSLGVQTIIESEALTVALESGKLDRQFDVIFDCAAYRSPFIFHRALTLGGRFVLVGGSMGQLLKTALFGGLVRRFTGRSYELFLQVSDAKLLAEVFSFIEQGAVRPLVDRTFTLAETAAALQYVEGRQVRGKVVIAVA